MEPKTFKNIRVFISSPGDMAAERDLVERVCREISDDIGGILSFRLDPVRWETHAHSGVSSRSQDVILSRIGEYQIYFGIMGYFFGSPTGKHDSGTEEEFREAYEVCKAKGSPKLQFYFLDAPVSPEDLDLDQLSRVKSFRKDIGDNGVFYRKFADLTDLEFLVRKALINDANEIISDHDKPSLSVQESDVSKIDRSSKIVKYSKPRNLSDLCESEKGIAAFLHMQNAKFELESVTSELKSTTKKIEAISKSANVASREVRTKGGDPKKQKYIYKKIEEFFMAIEDFINWFQTSIERTEAHFSKSLSALQRAASIQSELPDREKEDLGELVEPVRALRANFSAAQIAVSQAGLETPEIPSLGRRWVIDRQLYQAATADYADFFGRSIETLDLFAEQLDIPRE